MINLTPHEVVFVDSNSNVVMKVPSQGIVRVEMKTEKVREIQETIGSPKIPVFASIPGEITGYDFPKTQTSHVFIVSRVVAQAAYETNHSKSGNMYFPDQLVRNDKGQVVGCKGLGQFGAKKPDKMSVPNWKPKARDNYHIKDKDF